MIISHSHKFIYFSFPKTGSEAVRAALVDYSDVPIGTFRANPKGFYHHMPPAAVRDMFRNLGWHFDSYFKLTSRRNPFDRLVSLYRMIGRVDPIARLYQPAFHSWLRHDVWARRHQKWRIHGRWSLYDWAHDDQGQCLIDTFLEIGKTPEFLQQVHLPRKNDVPKTDVAQWYRSEDIEFVTRRYAWEIEKFKYQFPAPLTDVNHVSSQRMHRYAP